MSLNGNLEDLPLLDILQIVSFSKKTGFLAIQAEPGEGAIVFQEGFVVASFTWDSLPVDPRAASLPEAKRASLIRERIAMALEQLIRLREGQFSFSLTDEIPGTIANRDIRGETLHAGINPQELLLDLARGIDEDRRDSSAALEASFAQPMEEELLPELAPEDSADDVVADFVKGAQVGPAPEEDEPLFDRTMPLPALQEVAEAVEKPQPQPEPAAPPLPEPSRSHRRRRAHRRAPSFSWTTSRTSAGSWPASSGWWATRSSRPTSRLRRSGRPRSSGKPPRTSFSSPTSGCRRREDPRSRAGSRS